MKKVQVCCIIDDDPIFIYGTKRIIEKVDFCNKIIVYNNGQEAIDGIYELIKTKEQLPDVILLDINMPVMDGWEFLVEFKKLQNLFSKKIHIYIASSSVDPRDIERIKNYKEVSDYILKPITPDDLGKIISATTV
ncbi:MAG: response regulator [Maribacter arcticus]|uniref:response regulator n=1 Tax=Maribacter arcticus TaxID=561365 RepID=UPI0030025F5E